MKEPKTLCLLLEGPLMSWGEGPRLDYRSTALWPSKSGVVGLLANALGRMRNDPIDDLAALRLGLAAVRPGKLISDFQTVRGILSANRKDFKDKITRRQYLSGAMFVAGLEGPGELLTRLHEALADPARPLYLGRRGCLPSPPPYLPEGLRSEPLVEALGEVLLSLGLKRPVPLRLEAPFGEGRPRPDQPQGCFLKPLSIRYEQERVWTPPST